MNLKKVPGTLAVYLNKCDLRFLQGADIMNKIIVGTADWAELFTKHDFFHKYRYYLQVIASTVDYYLQSMWWLFFLSFNYSHVLIMS